MLFGRLAENRSEGWQEIIWKIGEPLDHLDADCVATLY